MWILSVALLLLATSIPWFVYPLYRVVPQKDVGHILEINVMGFWWSLGNLSDRLNRLQRDRDKAAKKLKKLNAQIEKEKENLTKRVEVIDSDYRGFLYDWNGRRVWRFLFRKVPVPSFSFIEPVEEERKAKAKAKRTSTWTLEDSDLPPEVIRSRGKIWYFRSPMNQRIMDKSSNNNQGKKKGGNQQQNQQQNNN